MIANRISGNIISDTFSDGKLNVPIEFEWFEADKKRMRKVAADGTEFGVAIGATIADGDVLAETAANAISPVSAPRSSSRFRCIP